MSMLKAYKFVKHPFQQNKGAIIITNKAGWQGRQAGLNNVPTLTATTLSAATNITNINFKIGRTHH